MSSRSLIAVIAVVVAVGGVVLVLVISAGQDYIPKDTGPIGTAPEVAATTTAPAAATTPPSPPKGRPPIVVLQDQEESDTARNEAIVRLRERSAIRS